MVEFLTGTGLVTKETRHYIQLNKLKALIQKVIQEQCGYEVADEPVEVMKGTA